MATIVCFAQAIKSMLQATISITIRNPLSGKTSPEAPIQLESVRPPQHVKILDRIPLRSFRNGIDDLEPFSQRLAHIRFRMKGYTEVPTRVLTEPDNGPPGVEIFLFLAGETPDVRVAMDRQKENSTRPQYSP